MFDFLKKKIGGFIENLAPKKEEIAPKPESQIPRVQEIPAPEKEIVLDTLAPALKSEPHSSILSSEKPSPFKSQISVSAPVHIPTPAQPDQTTYPKKETIAQSPGLQAPKTASVSPTFLDSISKPKQEPAPIHVSKTRSESVAIPPLAPSKPPLPVEIESDKSRVKLGAISSIKSFFVSQITLSESEIQRLIDDFELELLEADVDLSVAQSLVESLKSELSGKKLEKSKMHFQINEILGTILLDVLWNEKQFDLLERIESLPKPVKIVFIGINGAGKTTTMAKLAHLLQSRGKKVVFAAGDTFRAAAIEQLSVHAQNLGARIVKRDYGSDPTSVAYDAMTFAKAHNYDVVLIDTAGRQDTNISLINELKKMVRVISPDLKLYVGESVSGNAILEQVSSFNREIGVDGVILTKLDCDPKGGTVLSINKVTGVPILCIGIGQKYEDLEVFSASKMVSRILS
ncbi:signal recognition particle-docking protein FtsY [Candidatus Micrarchaeota archaeon]|nr:signal recognition particle-docking protein FtsY [Candidatus Micrarchaeota archaeon]